MFIIYTSEIRSRSPLLAMTSAVVYNDVLEQLLSVISNLSTLSRNTKDGNKFPYYAIVDNEEHLDRAHKWLFKNVCYRTEFQVTWPLQTIHNHKIWPNHMKGLCG